MFDHDQVVRRLWEDEGFRSSAYYDSEGWLTIGPGILIDERRGGGITAEEGMWLLRRRIIQKRNLCDRRFPWFKNLGPTRQQVIVCMAFQLGINGVANFKRMCAALEKKDFVEAAKEMMDSDWHNKQTPERAKRMANMMERGEWTEPSHPISLEE